MKIAVVGTGYVGLVTGTCLAYLGHTVTCMDRDVERIEKLQRGISPIYEAGLDELLQENTGAGRLQFSTSLQEALVEKDFLVLAVGTPADEAGRADLAQVEAVTESLAQLPRQKELLLVMKSTVPVGTCLRQEERLAELTVPGRYRVISCPEFLREGSAVGDFLHPDRIVIGARDQGDAARVKELFGGIETTFLLTDSPTAEMIKYASNGFLATKISFMNEIARLCEKTGADVTGVARGMGLDTRIGEKFLNAGLGYGGSCFPKDTLALISLAEDLGYDFRILKAVVGINTGQRRMAVEKLAEMLGGSLEGRTVGMLGLSFKPGTDDLREAPSLDIAGQIMEQGGQVQAYDPLVKEVPPAEVRRRGRQGLVEGTGKPAERAVKTVEETGKTAEGPAAEMVRKPTGEVAETLASNGNAAERGDHHEAAETLGQTERLTMADSPYEAAAGADAVILVTEWEEFGKLELSKLKAAMAGNVFLDGRNFLSPEQMRSRGFNYSGMGR